MLTLVTGDMFAMPARVRVNTVNCVGVMGKGVALAFKRRHPAMFEYYQKWCRAGMMVPGKLLVWQDDSALPGVAETIVNFPTKRHWRDNSRYEDIASGLAALRAFLETRGEDVVTLPALGCGHGGLDWGRVYPMIEDELGGRKLAADIRVFQPIDSRMF